MSLATFIWRAIPPPNQFPLRLIGLKSLRINRPADHAAVRTILDLPFDRTHEGDIVDHLPSSSPRAPS